MDGSAQWREKYAGANPNALGACSDGGCECERLRQVAIRHEMVFRQPD
jgi:hypothetical protein